MATNIEAFCRSCGKCQTNKINMQKPQGFLHSLPIPDKPWQSVGMCYYPYPDLCPDPYPHPDPSLNPTTHSIPPLCSVITKRPFLLQAKHPYPAMLLQDPPSSAEASPNTHTLWGLSMDGNRVAAAHSMPWQPEVNHQGRLIIHHQFYLFSTPCFIIRPCFIIPNPRLPHLSDPMSHDFTLWTIIHHDFLSIKATATLYYTSVLISTKITTAFSL